MNKNASRGYSSKKAIEMAMEHCEQNDILGDILRKQRGVVLNLLLNEFDVKSYESWIRKEGRDEGRKEGIIPGKAEDIIELLEEVGEVPDSLREMILEQRDVEQQKIWLKAASRAQSIEAFEKAVGLVGLY